MAEEEFATSSAQGANPEHDSKLVDFGFVQALTVGACLKGMDYLPSLNRIRMKFSAGQIIIVNLDRDLSPFQFDTSPTNYYESCFPIIFPESRSFTPLDFAQILIAVSSLHALLVMLDSSEVDAVRSMLLGNPGVAPEQLLDRDDRIEFVSAMRGSFFTEVKARTARGLKALQTLVGSVSKEGRELMMRRLRAEVRVAEANADGAEVEVQMKRENAIRERLSNTEKLIDIYNEKIRILPESDEVRKAFEAHYGILRANGAPRLPK